MTIGLPDFFKYNLWANLCLLDACAQLSDEQLDATTKGTFDAGATPGNWDRHNLERKDF